MVGWHHRLNGHGFRWTLGVGDEQGGLVCCGSWCLKESDMTEWLNWTEMNWYILEYILLGASLVTKSVHLLMQKACVQSLAQEGPLYGRATGPVHHNYLNLCSRARCLRAHALRQKRPPRWDAHAPQLESSLWLIAAREELVQQWRPSATENKYRYIYIFLEREDFVWSWMKPLTTRKWINSWHVWYMKKW